MKYRNRKVISAPLDEVRKKKFLRFGELYFQKKEVKYEHEIDFLYVDLNGTLTDEGIDLSLVLMEKLGETIYEKALKILDMGFSYKSQATRIVKLLDGIKRIDFVNAEEETCEEVALAEYIKEDISNLYPTRMVVFTGSPQDLANKWVQRHVLPLYAKGGGKFIDVYGTLLEMKDGILTGGVLRVMDERERENIRYTDTLRVVQNYHFKK